VRNKQYYVYILTNFNNKVLYTGVTEDLIKRVWQHKNSVVESFTSKYKVNKLVYFAIFQNPYEAIGREKQIKGGSRRKKLDLIETKNKKWKDLYDELL